MTGLGGKGFPVFCLAQTGTDAEGIGQKAQKIVRIVAYKTGVLCAHENFPIVIDVAGGGFRGIGCGRKLAGGDKIPIAETVIVFSLCHLAQPPLEESLI